MTTIKIPHTKAKAHAIFKQWKKDNPIIYKNIMSQGCKYGCNNHLTLHHKDGDKTNNDIKNLQCLCRKCHFKIHRTFQVRYKHPIIDYQDMRLIPNFIFRYLPRCGIKVMIIDSIPRENMIYW